MPEVDRLPNDEELRRLYDAAVRFRDLAPYEWMADEQLFAVRSPETQETGYCSVLGALGQQLGLVVYPGAQGLAGYRWTQEQGLLDDEEIDLAEMMDHTLCLMASFEDREMLQPHDREDIKRLGLRFRGRQAWPAFTSYRPGYAPWRLTGAEARLLAVALDQALEVCESVRLGTSRLDQALEEGCILTRVPDGADPAGPWHDEEVPEPEAPEPPPVQPAPVDQARIQEILRSLPRRRGSLEVDSFTAAAPVAEGREVRPYLPKVHMAIETGRGLILAMEAGTMENWPAMAAEVLLGAVVKQGSIPSTVEVCRQRVADALRPNADALGLRIRLVDQLPNMEDARASLDEHFRG